MVCGGGGVRKPVIKTGFFGMQALHINKARQLINLLIKHQESQKMINI